MREAVIKGLVGTVDNRRADALSEGGATKLPLITAY